MYARAIVAGEKEFASGKQLATLISFTASKFIPRDFFFPRADPVLQRVAPRYRIQSGGNENEGNITGG